MQLIVQYNTGGFDAWKAEYDARSDSRDAAGLTMLQMWRDADDPDRVAVLLEVNDRERAESWIKRQSALMKGGAAQFLKTA